MLRWVVYITEHPHEHTTDKLNRNMPNEYTASPPLQSLPVETGTNHQGIPAQIQAAEAEAGELSNSKRDGRFGAQNLQVFHTHFSLQETRQAKCLSGKPAAFTSCT